MTGRQSSRNAGIAVALAAIMVVSMFGLGFIGGAAASPAEEDEFTFVATSPAEDTSDPVQVVTLEVTEDRLDAEDKQLGEIVLDYEEEVAGTDIDHTNDEVSVEFIDNDGEVRTAGAGSYVDEVVDDEDDETIVLDIAEDSETEVEVGELVRITIDGEGEGFTLDNFDDGTQSDIEVTLEDDVEVQSQVTTVTQDLEGPIDVDGESQEFSLQEAVAEADDTVTVEGDEDLDEAVTQPDALDELADGDAENLAAIDSLDADLLATGDATIFYSGTNDDVVITADEDTQSIGDAETDEGLSLDGDGVLDNDPSTIVDIANNDIAVEDNTFENFGADGSPLIDVNNEPNINIESNTFTAVDGANAVGVELTETLENDVDIVDNHIESDEAAGIDADVGGGDLTIQDNDEIDVSATGIDVTVDANDGDLTLDNNVVDVDSDSDGIQFTLDVPGEYSGELSIDGNDVTADETGFVVDVGDSDDGIEDNEENSIDLVDLEVSDADTGVELQSDATDEQEFEFNITGEATDISAGSGIDVSELDADTGPEDFDVNVSDGATITVDSGAAIDASEDFTDTPIGLDITVDDATLDGDDSSGTGVHIEDTGTDADALNSLTLANESTFQYLDTAINLAETDGDAAFDLNDGEITADNVSIDNVANGLVIVDNSDNIDFDNDELAIRDVDVGIQAASDSDDTALDLGEGVETLDEGEVVLDGISVTGDTDEPEGTAVSLTADVGVEAMCETPIDASGVADGLVLNGPDVRCGAIEDSEFTDMGDGTALDIQDLDRGDLTIAGITVSSEADDEAETTAVNINDDVDVDVEDSELGSGENGAVQNGILTSASDNLEVDDDVSIGLSEESSDHYGIQHDGDGDLTVGDIDIELEPDAGTGIQYDGDSNTFDLGAVTIEDADDEGFSVDDPNNHATAGVDVQSGTVTFTDESDLTIKDVNTAITITEGAEIDSDTLTGLTLERIGDGAGLEVADSVNGALTLEDFDVSASTHSGGEAKATAVDFNPDGASDLDVEDSTEIGPVDNGIDIGTEADIDLTVDNVEIELADDGGFGVEYKSTNDLNINDGSLVIDGSGADHATTGVELTDDSADSILDFQTGEDADEAFEVSGVDTGLEVDDGSIADSELTGLTFTDIGDTAAIVIDDNDGAITFDDLTVDATDGEPTAIDYTPGDGYDLDVEDSNLGGDGQGAVNTGIDTESGQAITLTVEDLDIGLASEGGTGIEHSASDGNNLVVKDDDEDAPLTIEGEDTTLDIDGTSGHADNAIVVTDAALDFDTAEESDVVISGVNTGIDIQADASVDNTLTDLTLTEIGEGAGLDIDDNDDTLTLDGLTVEASTEDDEAAATAVDFSVDDQHLTVEGDTELGVAGSEVHTGITTDDVDDLTVDDITIRLAEAGGSGLDVDDSDAGDVTIQNALVIDGSAEDHADSGVSIDADSSSTDVNFEDGAAEDDNIDISGVEDGLVIETADSLSTDVELDGIDEGDQVTFDGVSLTDIGGADDSAAFAIKEDDIIDDETLFLLDVTVEFESAEGEGTGILYESDNDEDVVIGEADISGDGDTGIEVDTDDDVGFDITDVSSTIDDVQTGVSIEEAGTLNDDNHEQLDDRVAISNTEFEDVSGTALNIAEDDVAASTDTLEVSGVDISVGDPATTTTGTGIAFEADESDLTVTELNAFVVETGVNVSDTGNDDDVTVSDSEIIVANEGDAAGILVDDDGEDVEVDIQRNEIWVNGVNAPAEPIDDGSGVAIQLDGIDSDDHEIFLNDLVGFTADDGYALAGDDLTDLDEEEAVGNWFGNDSGPTADMGSNVGVSGGAPEEVRIYDPFLTADIESVEESIDDNTADSLDEVEVEHIRLFAHDLVLEPGNQMAFPADSERSLNETLEVRGLTEEEEGSQAFTFNAEENSWEPVTDADDRPDGFEAFAFSAETTDASATAAIEYRSESGGGENVRSVEYTEGFNIVPAQKNVDLSDVKEEDIRDGNPVESTQLFGLSDGNAPDDLNLEENVSIALTSQAEFAPYAQDVQSTLDADLYDVKDGSSSVTPEVSPFATAFVVIEQDDDDFDEQHLSVGTPQTMDEVLEDGVYEFDEEDNS